MYGAIANLHEVNVTGDGLAGAADDNAMLGFERLNVICGEPNRNFNRNRHAIVGEHEALKLRMALVVGADRGNDECGRFGCDVLLLNDDEPAGSMNEESSWEPRAPSSRRKRSCGQVVGIASRKSANAEKRAVEPAPAERLSSSVPSLRKASFARW